MNPVTRGIMFERKVALPVYEFHFGLTTHCTQHYVGQGYGLHQGNKKCDFEGRISERVEYKASQLQGRNGATFPLFFHWKAVRLDLFDELVLVGHLPDRVDVWLWDKSTVLTTAGIQTASCGHRVQIHGISEQGGKWELASNHPGKLLASLPFSDSLAGSEPNYTHKSKVSCALLLRRLCRIRVACVR
jgi:hypothetical protein